MGQHAHLWEPHAASGSGGSTGVPSPAVPPAPPATEADSPPLDLAPEAGAPPVALPPMPGGAPADGCALEVDADPPELVAPPPPCGAVGRGSPPELGAGLPAVAGAFDSGAVESGSSPSPSPVTWLGAPPLPPPIEGMDGRSVGDGFGLDSAHEPKAQYNTTTFNRMSSRCTREADSVNRTRGGRVGTALLQPGCDYPYSPHGPRGRAERAGRSPHA